MKKFERARKVLPLGRLQKALGTRRRRGERIVFTNGVFDLLHSGHIRYLTAARRLGDILVVGLNADRSVRRIKGPRRPLVPENERAELLSALDCVDYVAIFGDPTPFRLIKALRPDVLAKGADWAEKDIVGGDVVKAAGGKVARIRLARGRSTSNLIKLILRRYSG